MKTYEYLDAAKDKLKISSDYALAKRLDIRPERVSAYRAGRERPDFYVALKLAVILEQDPAVIFGDLQSQIEKNPAKAQFLRDFVLRAASEAAKAVRIMALILIAGTLGAAATGSDLEKGFLKRRKFA